MPVASGQSGNATASDGEAAATCNGTSCRQIRAAAPSRGVYLAVS